MPKYLLRVQLSQDGIAGYVKEGFATRAQYTNTLIEGAGGTIEATYFAYGDDDVIAVIDFSDSAGALALSMQANMSGVGRESMTPLITLEEMDEAASKLPEYRPPGQ